MTSVWEALARTPDDARTAGVEFLLQRQSKDGLWSDFMLAPGMSDEWITGYVGDRIADISGTQGALKRAWSALAARSLQRGGCGWGYNVHVPQDADSTAWALRLAQRVGTVAEPVAVAARDSLAAFVHDDGMVGTYGPTDDIAHFIGAHEQQDFRGWTSAHDCVTAAVAGVVGVVDPDVLLSVQRPDGRWRSYWWASDTFATALAVEALVGRVDAAPAIARAADWAAAMLTSEGLTPFESANLVAVTMLAGRGDEPRARAAVRALAFAMLPDGSWPPGAVLRVPHPQDTDPEGVIDWIPGGRIEGAVVEDQRRVFTTATVIHALDLALRVTSDDVERGGDHR